MNNSKPESGVECNCSIIANYKSILKEQHQSPEASSLRTAKLEILEKLIKAKRCPAGHALDFDDR